MKPNRRTWVIASLFALTGCRSVLGIDGREYRAKNDGGAPSTGTAVTDSAATTTSTATTASPATTTSTGGAGGCGDLLSNPHNCGACNHDCLGGDCILSKCQAFVISQTPASGQQQGLVVDPAPTGNVYWGEFRQGTPGIFSAPKSGASPTTVVSVIDDGGWMADMTSDGNQLFFTNYSDNDSHSSRGVYSVHFDGTELKQIAGGNVFGTYSLGYNSGYVYFLNNYDPRAIERVPTGGGSVEPVLTLPPSNNPNGLVFNMRGGIWVDDDWVYYSYVDSSSPGDEGIYRISHDGTNKTLLYNNNNGVVLTGIHNGQLYWNEYGGHLYHAPADGSGSAAELAVTESSLVFHGNYVYAMRGPDIVRFKEGVASPTEEFVWFADTPYPMTNDSVSLIWVEHYTGTVYRLAF